MITFDINRLVPHFIITDKNGYALAQAIRVALEYACQAIDDGIASIDNPERMPEWRLDEMAWELNATWYDYGATLERKRQIIAGAQDYYNRIGTPSAVESAIAATFEGGAIDEWFDYGGEPYHFQVRTSDVELLTTKRAKFLSLLEKVKNVRSVLDNIYYEGQDETQPEHVVPKVTSLTGTVYATAQRRDAAV